MNKDELFEAMGNPNNIFIAKTSFWTPQKFMFLGWILKIALAIAVVICMYRLNQYDHDLSYYNV